MRPPSRYFAALLALLLTAMASAAEPSVTHSEVLRHIEWRGTGDARTGMQFHAFGRNFALELAPNRRLLQSLDASVLPPGVAVYRGRVAGQPASWARLVIDDGRPSGLVAYAGSLIAIEVDDTTGQPFAFRLEDLQLPENALSCAAGGALHDGAELLQKLTADVRAQAAPGASSNLDIAVISDTLFTSDKGSGNAAAAMIARMNNVDGIFSEQLGVQLSVGRTDVFTAADDPFSGETESGALLDELSDYRNANSAQFNNGLSHLFTGRDLDSTTVGVAFTGAICSRRFGAGLTQATNSTTFDSLVAAHEIGHNFGAPHDGTSGSACESTPQDFIMAPRINGSDTFSTCSLQQMQSRVDSASCISPLPQADVAVSAGEQPSSPLLGNTERITFDVDAIGTDDVDDVAVTVTLPSGVTLDSVSASTGSCSAGAGQVSCDLGTIASGAGQTVSIISRLTGVGAARFDATVSASNDAVGGNNAASITLQIAPAVDLVATTPSATVTVDNATTVRIGVANDASIAATGVSVLITAEAGLRIDTASWPAGSCSIAAGDATCTASTLAAGASQTISLGVTGTTVGGRDYTVDVSGNETDRDPANNSALGTVTVNDAQAAPSDDGGGGAPGWPVLLLVLVAAFRRVLNDVLRSGHNGIVAAR